MKFVQIANYIFPTLLASTEEEKKEGLMWIKSNPPIMTFIEERGQINKIWMKNTFVALDIIFCQNGKILSIENGVPLSEKLIGPDQETDLVIELPKGTADKFAFKKGDSVELLNS